VLDLDPSGNKKQETKDQKWKMVETQKPTKEVGLNPLISLGRSPKPKNSTLLPLYGFNMVQPFERSRLP